MRIFALTGVILPLLFASAAYAVDPGMPKDWRHPTPEELGHPMRSEVNSRDSVIAADYGSDGLVDGAAILVKKDKTEAGLFAFIHVSTTGEWKWQTLDTQKYSDILSIGIGTHPPGEYQVLCDKDDDCDRSGKKEIELAETSLRYFEYEGSSSIFLWDKQKKTFSQVWEKK